MILAGAAMGWPLGASAQTIGGMKHIAVLMSGIESDPEGGGARRGVAKRP